MSTSRRRTPGVHSREPVMITGCSTGIGHATAIRLARSGHEVWATTRSLRAIEDLEAFGCHTLTCDVTDETSMATAIESIERASGALGALINNAGYGLYGPIEQLSMDDLRAQFETNVLGMARLIQLVMPKMRARGSGRIVNISSMGGRFVLPGGGAYHASKYAVEALSDALRLEVSPFGIKVVVVEPGPVRTPWTAQAASYVLSTTAGNDDPYEAYKVAVATMLAGSGQGVPGRFGSSAEYVAARIEKAISVRHPRTRYAVGPTAKLLIYLRTAVPGRVFDAFVRYQTHIPK